jgi:hypothetical protein
MFNDFFNRKLLAVVSDDLFIDNNILLSGIFEFLCFLTFLTFIVFFILLKISVVSEVSVAIFFGVFRVFRGSISLYFSFSQ